MKKLYYNEFWNRLRLIDTNPAKSAEKSEVLFFSLQWEDGFRSGTFTNIEAIESTKVTQRRNPLDKEELVDEWED